MLSNMIHVTCKQCEGALHFAMRNAIVSLLTIFNAVNPNVMKFLEYDHVALANPIDVFEDRKIRFTKSH